MFLHDTLLLKGVLFSFLVHAYRKIAPRCSCSLLSRDGRVGTEGMFVGIQLLKFLLLEEQSLAGLLLCPFIRFVRFVYQDFVQKTVL